MIPAPDAVLLDFAWTLFALREHAELLELARVPPTARPGLIERFAEADRRAAQGLLPEPLATAWRDRDLSHAGHRSARTAVWELAGVPGPLAQVYYDTVTAPEAWYPYPDTVEVLARLGAASVPVALVSNIGWDIRPTLRRHGVEQRFDAIVLSFELGVQKPDPAIFEAACRALDVDPRAAVMVGDTPETDGGAAAVGARYLRVPSPRPPGAVRELLGLAAV